METLQSFDIQWVPGRLRPIRVFTASVFVDLGSHYTAYECG